MRTTQRDDAPVTGFFEFQLITRCKHRLEGGENLCCAPGSLRGGCTFRCFRPPWRSTVHLRWAITQRFRPSRQQRATLRADGYVFMHEFRSVQPQIFEISPTPPRDFRVFTNGIKRNIQYPSVAPEAFKAECSRYTRWKIVGPLCK